MHPDFWHQRWTDNQIGFHQDTPTPLLLNNGHLPLCEKRTRSRSIAPCGSQSVPYRYPVCFLYAGAKGSDQCPMPELPMRTRLISQLLLL